MFKVLIAWNIVDCPIFSLHEVFLYDKLTLDHAQWVFLVIPDQAATCTKRPVPQVPMVAVI